MPKTALFDECRQIDENSFLLIKGNRVARLTLLLINGEQMPVDAVVRALSEKRERG